MKQHINEVKRMQHLAGLITESQLSELNEPEKELVDAILGEGINEGKFNPKEILAKLIAVAKKGLLTATIISTVLASCNFGPSVDETIQNRLDQYKTIDSMALVQKERDEAFKNKIDSLKQDLKAIEYPVTQSQQESLSEIRQLVRETINEVIKSGVREMWADIKDALANARIVTVDDVEIDKAISGAGAVRGIDGKIYRIQTPEYLSEPERIKIEDANGEMKSPVITLYSDTELGAITKRVQDQEDVKRQAWNDRYGPNGGYETRFGRYTGD
jgi:hypothetical protein